MGPLQCNVGRRPDEADEQGEPQSAAGGSEERPLRQELGGRRRAASADLDGEGIEYTRVKGKDREEDIDPMQAEM